MDRQPIISAKDVEITFSLRGRKLNAIRKCSLDLYEGEPLAIVGESGSGKSVFTKTFVGMLDANGMITGGSIMYEGRDMTKFTEKDWLGVRGKKIAMVIRGSSGGFRSCKAMGFMMEDRGIAQVSMNMVNYEDTPLYVTNEMLKTLAPRIGTNEKHRELVSLTPAKAMIDCAEFYLKAKDFDCKKQVMEYHLIDME